MRKFLLLIITFVTLHSYSQQITFSGKVIDTSENIPLNNAVISLLRQADSVLLNFTRSDKNGDFLFTRLDSANFIMLVTYPGYADYVDIIRDTAKKNIKSGNIPLTRKSQLLEAVIVRQKIAAIRMNGDTLEYKADSFAVRPGATVDELLKRLPGIQVNRNGEITAQGQKVNKVLVDGEEFFSEDPAVVIKNLQADAVKEVQVFDKKSAQSEFTGIDDGQRSKTINLTLKADKKKGYFAKVNAGGGTGKTFDNDVMMNAFKGSRKVAAYGIMSNTGRVGLDWQDNDRFGGGNNIEYNEENGYYMRTNYDEEFDQDVNNDEGLPSVWSAGLHYSDKWKEDKKKINTNYRYLKKNLDQYSNTISQFILPDTQYFNTESRRAFNSRIGQQLKGTYDLKFDSLTSMKITIKGSMIHSDNASRLNSSALNADSGKVNLNDRLLNSAMSKNNFNASIIWRKKFRVKGRTLSINFDQQATDQASDGLLISNTEYYNTIGEVYKQENLDQKKKNTQNNIGMQTSVVYTEPLSKDIFLSLNYGYNFNRTESFRKSFNKNSGSGEYDKRDSTLSNDFRFGYNTHTAGADIKINKKKMMLLFGSGVNYAAFRQTDLLRDSVRNYSFVNFFPKVILRFKPTTQRNFVLMYNGRTNPPSMEQLQPVRENSDPLNIRLGNPSLRQEFQHDMSVNFFDYKVISSRNVYAYSYSNIYQNAISTSTNVDNGGKTTVQFINVNGNYSGGLMAGYGWQIKKVKIDVGFGGGINYSRMSNRINNLENINNFKTVSFEWNIGKYVNEKYNFYMRPSISYTNSKSSLRPDIKTNFFASMTQFNAWTKLPLKFEFSTSANINLRQKIDLFDRNRNTVKWDIELTKKLLKNNNLELKAGVFDLLNQNIGFNRMVNTNFITEKNYNTLQRYWMLKLQYTISKAP